MASTIIAEATVERAGGGVDKVLCINHMLRLCYCEHCVEGAIKQDVNVEAQILRITADIDQYLNSSLEMSDEEANERLECESDLDSEIAAYVRYRCNTATSLVL